MANNLLLCCGVKPITSIKYQEPEREPAAYTITCEICGRMAVDIFTDDAWQEAREKAREKWNRSIVEEIKERKDG